MDDISKQVDDFLKKMHSDKSELKHLLDLSMTMDKVNFLHTNESQKLQEDLKSMLSHLD